ncbi:STN and carboxypeptidase regulatory-like domain-containing protein [Dyadobacter sp. NIV53]|uniref:STN and carboxypeptidase regulatory-like domain-containing protein n=1 Tax=Dyadobacter sp. NIV53 TaxID=2861765 RepID=UPI001E5B4950|nr:STN and carboxypeptidase regulatory-like domain-containing protein [Dyadobacter sp. NIV53]
MNTFRLTIYLTFFILFSKDCFGQQLLEKRISISITNQPVDQVLQRIGNLGGFSFSYSPDAIDVKAKVSVQATSLTIREILNEIFKGKVGYKERRKYIILQKIAINQEGEAPENFNLNGYIIDKITGEKLANASIYESVTLASTISNQYGYYRIRLPTAPASLRLEIRKEDYIARSIPVSKRKDAYLPITLNPDTLKPISRLSPRTSRFADSLHQKVEIPQFTAPATALTVADTTHEVIAARRNDKLKKTYQKVQSELVTAFASAKQAINTRNIPDTLHRHFQASLLPFLGTNHELSGNIVNDISVNLIAGYSLGVNMLEIGAILNVVRSNVTGFQLAGISNIVGNDVTGFQYANVLNITLGNFVGFQGSNVINYTGKNFRGFQVSSVGNVVVGALNGYQLSAVYNYANTVRSGHQIGVVNYTDSTATVPFGLFSYVRSNGYRRYEFASNEFNYFNFSFKTGVSRFYNIFSLGFNALTANKPLGTIGYGFGTAQKLGKTWMLDADVTANAVILKRQSIDNIPAGLFRFSLNIEKKFGNRFALFAGPSINLLTGDYTGLINTERTGFLKPIWINTKPNSWIGFQAGIRL